MRRRNYFLTRNWAGALLLISCLALTACGDNPTTNNNSTINNTPATNLQATSAATNKNLPPVKVAIGYTAPDFTAKDLNGQPLELNALRGKAVLLNFWATYCEPCQQELPGLIKSYNANKDKLVIVGINWNEDTGVVKQHVKDTNTPYPITIDSSGDLILLFHARGQPTNIFIDPNGVITNIVPGMVTPEIIDQQIAKTSK